MPKSWLLVYMPLVDTRLAFIFMEFSTLIGLRLRDSGLADALGTNFLNFHAGETWYGLL
jgi:hypothetical protein